MFVRATTALVFGVGLIAFTPRWSYADCEIDFTTEFNIQVTTDNDTSNEIGTAFVRQGWTIDIPFQYHRVDLKFYDIGENQYRVELILQERTDDSDFPRPDSTYKQVNSTALAFDGAFGVPVAFRPAIGGVEIEVALFAYPKGSEGY